MSVTPLFSFAHFDVLKLIPLGPHERLEVMLFRKGPAVQATCNGCGDELIGVKSVAHYFPTGGLTRHHLDHFSETGES